MHCGGLLAKRYLKPRKYKRSKRPALTVERKARSMQTSWRKATDKTGTMSIADAKALIEKPPTCIYCEEPIQWQQLSIDHMQPRSREGTSTPDNLIWTCRECNITKGNLTADEFKLLLAFLNQHPVLKSYLLPRLKAGGAVFGRRRRRR